jgi:hypothetical protein
MKLSQATNKAIRLARKVREYYAAELPKYHPAYPLVGAAEDEPPPPPEEAELRQFLESLSPEMVYQLLLVMHLGRGDIETRDLAESFAELKPQFGSPEWAISQMVEKPALADYLSDGLQSLKESRIDADRLPVK